MSCRCRLREMWRSRSLDTRPKPPNPGEAGGTGGGPAAAGGVGVKTVGGVMLKAMNVFPGDHGRT